MKTMATQRHCCTAFGLGFFSGVTGLFAGIGVGFPICNAAPNCDVNKLESAGVHIAVIAAFGAAGFILGFLWGYYKGAPKCCKNGQGNIDDHDPHDLIEVFTGSPRDQAALLVYFQLRASAAGTAIPPYTA
jgi:hypothetical protein